MDEKNSPSVPLVQNLIGPIYSSWSTGHKMLELLIRISYLQFLTVHFYKLEGLVN